MPELTVVIPTKDRPTMLPRAIQSVLDQVEDVEVIVVDDGSTPANAEAIRRVCASDARIRLLRNEVPHGAPHGRNQGLAVAEGGYWATLDDDDQWLPGKWSVQWAILEECGFPSDLVVVAGVRSVALSGPEPVITPEIREPERLESLPELFRRVRIAAFLNTYVAPTSLMRAIGGYDDRLVWGEHTDVLIRLAKLARFAGSEHAVVLLDREHEQMSSRVGRDWVRKVEGLRLLLEKHRTDFDRSPEVRGLYEHVLGVSQLRAGDRWGAVRTFARVVRSGDSPGRRARGLVHLVTAVLGGQRLWRWVARARGIRAETIA